MSDPSEMKIDDLPRPRLLDAWVWVAKTEEEAKTRRIWTSHIQASAEYPSEIAERVAKDYYVILVSRGIADDVSELWAVVDYEAYGGQVRLPVRTKIFRVGIKTKLVFEADEQYSE